MTKKTRTTSAMIWSLAKAYPGRSAAALVLLLCAGISEGIGLAAALPLLDTLFNADATNETQLGKLAAAIFESVSLTPTPAVLLTTIALFLVLKGLATLAAMANVGWTLAHLTTHLRLNLIRALMRARWSYFTSQPTSRFSNAITSEAERAASAYLMACKIGADAIQITIYAIVAIFISWQIMLGAIVFGGIVMLLLSRLIRLARNAGERQTGLQRSLVFRLTDGLQGIKPLKAMARENLLGPLLETETQGLNKALRDQVVSREAMLNLPEPIIAIVLCSGLYVGIVHFEIPFESLAVMALLFHRTAMRLGRLQAAYQRIAQGESAYWSLQEAIESASQEAEQFSGQVVPRSASAIRLEDVSFSYGDKSILENLSFSIPGNRLTTILGPSGAGKTTITDLLIGLSRPDSGEIWIDNLPLGDINLQAWRGSIGYVPQEMFLFHDTILANVLLADPELDRNDAEMALRAAGAWDFIDNLSDGVDTIVGERGTKLSGGQRQRIAIARALVRRPNLLILDEVTASLDPRTESDLCATLRNLTDHLTILAITHKPAIIEVSDVVYKLENKSLERVSSEVDLQAASSG